MLYWNYLIFFLDAIRTRRTRRNYFYTKSFTDGGGENDGKLSARPGVRLARPPTSTRGRRLVVDALPSCVRAPSCGSFAVATLSVPTSSSSAAAASAESTTAAWRLILLYYIFGFIIYYYFVFIYSFGSPNQPTGPRPCTGLPR